MGYCIDGEGEKAVFNNAIDETRGTIYLFSLATD